MKTLILVLALAMLIVSCNKQARTPLASKPEKITVAELKAKYNLDLVAEFEKQYGPARTTPNGKKKPTAQLVLTVTEDLVISGSVSCTTSPDAEWGGIQKFLALPLAIDGAVSYCNFNWSYTAAPASMDCPTTTAGVYRGWTSDKVTYDVHLSAPLVIE